jgi:hypothetical protein
MNFYRINKSPDVDLVTECVLEGEPERTQPIGYKMAKGKSAAAEYPRDAKWYMSDQWPGIKLPSILNNSSTFLVVHADVKRVIESLGVPVESYGFTLYDHKKRIASKDHFIVNPLGTFDCLNLQKSEIKYSKTHPDEIIRIFRYVLDPRKLESAPPLFRIKEDPRAIVFSQEAVNRLKREANPTNAYFFKLDQEA